MSIKVNLSDLGMLIPSQIHMVCWWLSGRTCVGCLHGLHALETGIPPASSQFGGSCERKSRHMSNPCVSTSISSIFGCLLRHKYICECSGSQTEYARGTCVDWNPGHLQHPGSLAEVEGLNTKF